MAGEVAGRAVPVKALIVSFLTARRR